MPSDNHVIESVSSYIAATREMGPPDEVLHKAKHHVMDTLAAMVSGYTFKPGTSAAAFVRSQGGVEESQVVGDGFVTSAVNAALANGMMAHGDETDDSHEMSLTHPGCAVVPAALAVSERGGASGLTFLKGVVTGYDIGCRVTQALGVKEVHGRFHSTHSIGGGFGAAAAAAAILGLSPEAARVVLSYAGQQASGVTYWTRDPEHVEKAFVFGGMPARNGVMAALMVASGCTGVPDLFSGESNFLAAFSRSPEPGRLAGGLGEHFEISVTNIKRFAVGSPIQAPLDALLLLVKKHGLTASDVERITVCLPAGESAGARVVDNRQMPSVNMQFILAVALLDGTLTFQAAHAAERMADPEVTRLRDLISVVLDSSFDTTATARQAIVQVTVKGGTVLSEHVVHVRGTAHNPMTDGEVEQKCLELFEPVIGEVRASKLVETVWNLESVADMRDLRPLLRVKE
jgi:2-methylcitrate dehydratase PrpD